MEDIEEKIKIIYEDKFLLAVDKPAGLTVDGLKDWLLEKKHILLPRAGIVHRLDKGTSGVLLVAKTEEVLVELKKQFKERLVEKVYVALVEGDLPFRGEIKMPVARSKYRFAAFTVSEVGKEALTRFEVTAKFKRDNKTFSLVEVKPKTGRTHQIRVHFTYMGWSLVGDKFYGSKDSLQRPFLHAHSLKFHHPKKGEMKLISDLPEDLESHLKSYG